MIYEFQVLYQPASESKELIPLRLRAEDELQARRLVEAAPGCVVIAVKQLEPVVNWSKPFFNIEEAAAILGRSVRRIQFWQQQGLLSRPRANGHSIFHISELERFAKTLTTLEKSEKAAAKKAA